MWFIFSFLFSLSSFAVCGAPQILGRFQDAQIHENSGMDFSTKHRDVFWTLNDKNNLAELFAANISGQTLATYKVVGVENDDWEDISVGACAHNPLKQCLYVAATGNNKGDREKSFIHIFEEPSTLVTGTLKPYATIVFKPSGLNFEAMAYNENTQEFFLLSKIKINKDGTIKGHPTIYSLNSQGSLKEVFRIPFDKLPSLEPLDKVITAADYDSKKGILLIGTYGKAYEIEMKRLADFSPKIILMPKQDKAEAITYYRGSIITSSEGVYSQIYGLSCP